MNKTVYLVEDSFDISEMIEYLLKETGMEVMTSATVSNFYQRLKVQLPDLIIMDIMLPDGNGVDVCKALKSNSAMEHIPIILMSAHANSNVVIQECSANDFIAKPFDIHEFIRRVQLQVAS